MKIHAYVDALNLYYRALKNTPYKWLNLVDLVNQNLPARNLRIDRLKYFTSNVTGIVDPETPNRQRVYLNALETLPEVSVIFGNLIMTSLWRPVLNLPIADCGLDLPMGPVTIPSGDFPVHVTDSQPRMLPVRPWRTNVRSIFKKVEKPDRNAVHAQVHTMQEKGSDVNLAVHLVNDAWRDSYDMAVVITNDRDLAESIRLVIKDVKKEVILLCPDHKRGVTKRLWQVASDVRYIRPGQLRKSQFPDTIPGTSIQKPAGW